jgi:hypothetical protein
METRVHDMARLFVANGFGFGQYRSGYIFARTPKDAWFFYLSDRKMAILSAGIDADGERDIVAEAEAFAPEALADRFGLDLGKTSAIDWLRPVRVILRCDNAPTVRNNLIYYTWPALRLEFVTAVAANTLVVCDRSTPPDVIEALRQEAIAAGVDGQIEWWSMLKLLAMGDRFGELAPKICMSAIPSIRESGT